MLFHKRRAQSSVEQKPTAMQKPKLVEDETGMMDIPFLVLTLLLLLIGLIMLFSASYARAYYDTKNATQVISKQIFFAGIGLVGLLACARLNYQIIQRFSIPLLFVALVLLLAVLLVGENVNGATRWINLGFNFQPSEVSKAAVVLSLAACMTVYQKKMDTLRYGLFPYLLILGAVALLLWLEPHKSATIIILLVGFVMMYLGGTKPKYLLTLVLIGVAVVVLYVLYKLVLSSGGGDYAQNRIIAWLNPEKYKGDESYQIVQSQYAIGSGGLTGLGLGKSRQKYMYLPEEHNDYIFAIVCEELGLIGAIGILILFALLIVRGYWIAIHAPDRFSKLTAAGFMTLLATQVIFNVGVVTNLLPPTGISLPFFSSGGTALAVQLSEIGIVLGISRWTKKAIR